ncbi:sensor histidine kinase [candidate division KSB1 bacterium]|nr:sensor histidine kinase [candidate division KSB1 bacterium]
MMTFISHKNDKLYLIGIGSLIVLVAILHYRTPTHLHVLHELYRVLFYVPIILAAFRYQLNGGVIAAIAVIAIYLPHVVFQWGGDFLSNFSRFLQMVMYLIIGSITGMLAARERREQVRYQQTAEKLEASYATLQQQSEQMADIEDQLRQAERLSSVGELAANLAHEVRNPLGSIWGVVDILKSRTQPRADTAEFMNILIKEVNRLNEVVENYTVLSRQSSPVRIQINLTHVVQSTLQFMQLRTRKESVQLEMEFPADPVTITANETELRQVIINLVLNAIAASPVGGTVKIWGTNGNASTAQQLAIIDEGAGIASDQMPNLFKPFYTTKSSGTGLGLSIVKRIVDRNNWTLDVKSEPGKGATFTISF